ncbi:FadR/GntR family transcriptional regulator [Sciscionella sediminilitoris]|uniref:FadR/GntR family transcriptional regulator n=1 Tax=Sciscionella sediminilitoris TaxID=1445613 RepID=UPI0004DF2E92|nr:FCD domain-containing protein [Sciscionella sp. SE31]
MHEAGIWTPLRQGRVADLISDRILEVIANEQLRSGDRLPPERELANLLGTSRPSVREALRSLQAQGRVEIRHGTGVFVADPATTKSLREAMAAEEMSLAELFDMREVLELPAAGWAASNQDEKRLNKVREAHAALDAAAAKDPVDWEELQRLDAAFHLRIVEAAGNRFLSQTLGVLQEMLAKGMQTTLQIPGRMEKSREDHQRMLDAVLSGDARAARRAASTHVRGARKAALARIRDEQEKLDATAQGDA